MSTITYLTITVTQALEKTRCSKRLEGKAAPSLGSLAGGGLGLEVPDPEGGRDRLSQGRIIFCEYPGRVSDVPKWPYVQCVQTLVREGDLLRGGVPKIPSRPEDKLVGRRMFKWSNKRLVYVYCVFGCKIVDDVPPRRMKEPASASDLMCGRRRKDAVVGMACTHTYA